MFTSMPGHMAARLSPCLASAPSAANRSKNRPLSMSIPESASYKVCTARTFHHKTDDALKHSISAVCSRIFRRRQRVHIFTVFHRAHHCFLVLSSFP